MPKRKRSQPQEPSTSVPTPEPVTPTRPKRTRSPKKSAIDNSWDAYGGAFVADLEREDSPLTDLDGDVSPKKKGGRKRKKKNPEPVVYTEKDIPPVEKKITQFKGELGYACLNTVLRAAKPEPIFSSRTCRKDTIHKNGIEFAKELGLKNTRDLVKLIEWNEENSIRFLRISSEMFPFASHAELGYDLSYAASELKAVGDLAKKLGHRLTAHPGQFTQLASPKEAVVEASVRELDYHCQMMRYMGLGKDSVIILHMGGVYNDKPSTIARFRENYLNKLTQEMRDRLVLENDEMCYSVDDLLPVCEELSVPIVLDYHHNWINPSSIPLSTLIPRLNSTWHAKHIHPKQHLSSPKPQFADGSGNVMERRAHADRCYELPEELNMEGVARDVDLMIEAKDKEQAVLMLYRIYGLEDVQWGNLRPEKKGGVDVGKEEDGGEGGEEVEEDRDGDPGKRRRRTKSAKAETEVLGGEGAERSPQKRMKKTKGKKGTS
ncbi:UV-endonuclease UvdE-domain-containing protein [Irpex rosettiformis]|uniref:UV-endonuclease UvdE-domain-containing protein n=1 Tax=Irpex rosettiformis TaxID=378272 RepID=A0ACB8U447_9APHY|nr:UV-endonuclease UvdE-domain-containing protein [Irpex rosettiformis]